MKKWYQQTDVMLGLAIIAVLALLVIPIPAFLLDTLMGLSVLIGLITMLTAMYNKDSADFSVFPSLLLVSTVFRLSINVSSTRLILLEGPSFEGQLVRAFGEFVVGGNYVIGFIIFVILVLVQMMVITKGATRISEVAARFSLDALPGKQMSIDSDMAAGLLSEEEAERRREKLRSETDFYGQMDGATKFVQGDVRVGLVITAINIIGGFIVGMAIRGEDFGTALETYTLLTIGDGLIAQIPSLLITTATGMVVTRATAKEDLAGELKNQMFMNPKILWMTSGTLLFMSILPGFPKLSLWLLGGWLGFLAYQIGQNIEKTREEEQKAEEEEKRTPGSPDQLINEFSIDPLKVELGVALLTMADQKQPGNLIERIRNLRQKFAKEMGMIIPPVRITDNIDLPSNDYSILVGGTEVAKANIDPDRLVAMNMGQVTQEVQGEPYQDPAFGQQCLLINKDQKNEAEGSGYLVVDPANIIITHLSEVIRNHSSQIMGRQEIHTLLEKLKEKFPLVTKDVNDNVKMSTTQAVIHNLLKENVSIRNMVQILEVLADHGATTNDTVALTELVRQRLGRQIISQYADKNEISVIQVDPGIESIMRDAIAFDEREGRIFALDPNDQVEIRNAFVQTYNSVQEKQVFPVFITSAEVRMGVFSLLEREISSRSFAVISYEEHAQTQVEIKLAGKVALSQQEATSDGIY